MGTGTLGVSLGGKRRHDVLVNRDAEEIAA